jgi:tetratricopeptide (TPR) repeat protein
MLKVPFRAACWTLAPRARLKHFRVDLNPAPARPTGQTVAIACLALSDGAARDIVRRRPAGACDAARLHQLPGKLFKMHDLSQRLNQAVDFHRKGNFAAAEGLYLQLLDARADHFDVLQMLGFLRYQQRRFPEALSSIGAALQARPDFPPALLNHGLVLDALERHEEALASYDKALAIQPAYAEALYNRGIALRSLGRLAEALASFERALAIRPGSPEALYNRGSALQALRRPAEALDSYDKALAIKPDYVEALNNRSLALLELHRPAEALASFDQALAIEPNHAKALNNRGNTLQELKRPAEALASYDKALAIQPTHVEALYNRGIVLRDLHRPAEALASFDQALAFSPDHVDALNNRGVALRDLDRPAEALASYDKALSIKPDYAETHSNRSCLRLLLGDFEQGFEEFEWRWRVPEIAPLRRDFAAPLWLGEEPLAGKTILLHAEQGFGDAIQFVRYAPLVAARGAKVILEVPPALTALFSGIAGVALVIGRGEKLPGFDCHCPLLSLPLAFKTRLATIPAAVPYLSAAQDRMTKWQQRLPQLGKRRIGIAWAGNPAFKSDQTRSVGLARLSRLLGVAGVEFFSLQRDLREGDRDLLRSHSHIMQLGAAMEDFGDTAAIMACLDLVISSDTAVAHLAGALGKPVWVLLQYVADWRWLLDRDDSPWYPTARLFRQPAIGDWESVISQVERALSLA